MATIGHKAAVADAFGMKFTGFIAYIMWGFIHVLYLVGWGNRLGTIYTWARAIWFSNNRGHRIITFERTMVELDENRKKGRAPVVTARVQTRRWPTSSTPRRAHPRPDPRASTTPGRITRNDLLRYCNSCCVLVPSAS